MGQLTKDYTITTIPGRAAQPGSPAVAFRIYAPPPPLGYAYRSSTGNPDTLSEVQTWSALYRPPEPTSSQIVGYVFKTDEQIVTEYGGQVPQGSREVLDGLPPEHVGWDVPVVSTVPLGPQWYGAIDHMTLVTFPGPTSPNGFPTYSATNYVGTFTVPVLPNGTMTVTRTYRKTGPGGALVPVNGYVDPAYCQTVNTIRVCVLSNFPGSPFVPAVADQDIESNNAGWNAGTESIESKTDNFQVVYTPHPTSGPIILGFAESGSEVFERAFRHETGVEQCYVYRDDVAVAGPFASTPGDEFTIRRVDNVTSYYVGENLIYIDPTPYVGEKVVRSEFFSSGDYIE